MPANRRVSPARERQTDDAQKDQHPIIGALMKNEPKEISEFEQAIRPRDYRVFAGVIDLDHWPAWGRLLFKALGGQPGDNRQWPDIDAWAEDIAKAIRAEPKTNQ